MGKYGLGIRNRVKVAGAPEHYTTSTGTGTLSKSTLSLVLVSRVSSNGIAKGLRTLMPCSDIRTKYILDGTDHILQTLGSSNVKMLNL